MLAAGLIDYLFGQTERLAIVLSLLAVLSGLAIWLYSRAWQRVRLSADRARIVSDMLQRGHNAEEIARVLLAADLPLGSIPEERASESPEVRTVKTLSDNCYESGDIQRILAAANARGGVDERTAEVIITLAGSWAATDAIIATLESRRRPEAAPAPATKTVTA